MKAVLMMELTNDVRPVRREIETQQFRTCCDLEKKASRLSTGCYQERALTGA